MACELKEFGQTGVINLLSLCQHVLGLIIWLRKPESVHGQT